MSDEDEIYPDDIEPPRVYTEEERKRNLEAAEWFRDLCRKAMADERNSTSAPVALPPMEDPDEDRRLPAAPTEAPPLPPPFHPGAMGLQSR